MTVKTQFPAGFTATWHCDRCATEVEVEDLSTPSRWSHWQRTRGHPIVMDVSWDLCDPCSDIVYCPGEFPDKVAPVITENQKLAAERDQLQAALLDAHRAFLVMRAVYLDSLLDPAVAGLDRDDNVEELENRYTLERCVTMAQDSEVYLEYAGSTEEGWLPVLGWSYNYDTDKYMWAPPAIAEES